MPQQLIYTSAPQGVDAGRSGYCTVARSSTMSESLAQRLEQCSYYERLSEHGGEQERVIYNFRNIDIRGKVYHVLSRIQDAPADYTGRTNFIAHHLVFSPDEVANKSANIPTPAVILRHWPDWKKNWEQEPTLIDNESEPKLNDFHNVSHLPADNWYRETGNRGRAAALLGHSAGVFTANDFKPEIILDLLTESLELLQLEGDNWRSLAWQRTFSVGCQPQDNPADFRWRFLTSNLPFESSTTQGRAPLELKRLRGSPNSRQLDFAEKGPGKPKFMRLPEAGKPVQIDEGQPLELDGQADSLPGPCIYRWLRIEKDKNTEKETEITQNAQLVDPNVRRGKNYYKVRAWDQLTDKFNESHQIVVEVKEKVKIPSLSGRPANPSGSGSWSPNASQTARNPAGATKSKLTLAKRNVTSPSEHDSADHSPPDRSARSKLTWVFLTANCILLLGVIGFIILRHKNFWDPIYKDDKKLWNALEWKKKPTLLIIDEQLKKSYYSSIETNSSNEKIKKDIEDIKDKDTKKEKTDPVTIDLLINDIKKAIREDRIKKSGAKQDIPPKKEAANSVNHAPPPSPAPPGLDTNTPAPPPPTPDSPPPVRLAIIKPQDPLNPKIEIHRQQIQNHTKSKKKSEDALNTTKLNLKEAKEKTLEKLKADTNKFHLEIIASTKQLQKSKEDLLKLEEKAGSQTISELDNQTTRNKFFDINTPPQLEWHELGKTSAQTISGVPIKSGWQFRQPDKWALSLTNKGNQAVAVLYSSNLSDLPIIVKIPYQQEPVRKLEFLLLPSTNNESTSFYADVGKDILKPKKELEDFLRSIKPEHQKFIHSIIRYPRLDNLPTNSVDQIVSMLDKNNWKLTIEAKLAGQKTEYNKYEETLKVIDKLESVWVELWEENKLQLREEKFWPTVKSEGKTKDQKRQQIKFSIIERVNRLIDVAIYEKDGRNKYLTEETNYTNAVEKIKENCIIAGNEKYKEKITGLIESATEPTIARLMEFINKHDEDFSPDSLKDKIKELGENDKPLEPHSLEVYLEYQDLDGKWVRFSKINCARR